MPNIFKNQFKKRNFAFYCYRDERELFYVTQWSESTLVYLVYRIIIWAYQVGWMLAYYIYTGINSPYALGNGYLYLTRWGYTINTIYFTMALILSIVGFKRRNSILRHDYTSIKWLRSATWLFHAVGQAAAVVITVVYWAALSTYVTPEMLANPFNIDVHAINSVLYLIEIFVIASPMRLLHFIYPMAFGVAYIIATLIYFAAGITSAVYPILDWENNPGLAAGISVALCFVGTIVAHGLMFGLYCLRTTIANRRPSADRHLEGMHNLSYVPTVSGDMQLYSYASE